MPRRNLLNTIKKLDDDLKLPWYNPDGVWKINWLDAKNESGDLFRPDYLDDADARSGTLDELISTFWKPIELKEASKYHKCGKGLDECKCISDEKIYNYIWKECMSKGKAQSSDGDDWWIIWWVSND